MRVYVCVCVCVSARLEGRFEDAGKWHGNNLDENRNGFSTSFSTTTCGIPLSWRKRMKLIRRESSKASTVPRNKRLIRRESERVREREREGGGA